MLESAPRGGKQHLHRNKTVTTFELEVHRVLQGLGSGEVVTYEDVAREAGFPGAARAVGSLLARTDIPVPWWRVVTAGGRLVPGHEREQAAMLRGEGVRVVALRVQPAELRSRRRR